MITPEQIQRGGSKLEITRLLIEKGFKHVPESVFLYAGQDFGSVRPEIEKLLRKGRIICRGSHPNDYHGFVDVVPTTRNITSFSQLEQAVKEAEKFMRKPEVKKYSELNDGQPYEPVVHFLIQQQSASPYLGQAIEHPHEKTTIIGNAIDVTQKRDVPIIIQSINDTIIATSGWIYSLENVEKDAQKLFKEIIPEMKSLGVLDPEFAQNYEFDLREGLIFQARPFKKLQEPAKFEIEVELKHIFHLSSPYAFGITPKEGINLPQVEVHSDDCLISDRYTGLLSRYNRAFALHLLKSQEERKSSGLGVIFQNLRAYSTDTHLSLALGHAHYRFMKKAEFSFFDCFPENKQKRREVSQDNWTYISNGITGAIVPTEYLK